MIGKNILFFRELKGFTQTELAQAIGHTSPAYISFLEKGKRNISANDLLKISNVLGVPIEQFFGASPEVDTTVLKLKAGQTVYINGMPLEILGDSKASIHAGSYAHIKKFLL